MLESDQWNPVWAISEGAPVTLQFTHSVPPTAASSVASSTLRTTGGSAVSGSLTSIETSGVHSCSPSTMACARKWYVPAVSNVSLAVYSLGTLAGSSTPEEFP